MGASRVMPWSAVVETMGFEPTTPCLQSRCSSQLSYVPGAIGQRTGPSGGSRTRVAGALVVTRTAGGARARRWRRPRRFPSAMKGWLVGLASSPSWSPRRSGSGSRGTRPRRRRPTSHRCRPTPPPPRPISGPATTTVLPAARVRRGELRARSTPAPTGPPPSSTPLTACPPTTRPATLSSVTQAGFASQDQVRSRHRRRPRRPAGRRRGQRDADRRRLRLPQLLLPGEPVPEPGRPGRRGGGRPQHRPAGAQRAPARHRHRRARPRRRRAHDRLRRHARRASGSPPTPTSTASSSATPTVPPTAPATSTSPGTCATSAATSPPRSTTPA